jgi:tetratricopeptide (TPR) repeat protein
MGSSTDLATGRGSRRRRRPTLWTAVAAVLVVVVGSTVRAPVAAAQQRGHLTAIVIGVNDYEDPRIPDLKYCVADSIAMYQTLTRYGGYEPEAVLLLNDWGGIDEPKTVAEFRARSAFMPTLGNIRERLPGWLAQAGPQDTVLVFFSGHGFLVEGETVLATLDCKEQRPADTGLRSSELLAMLDRCPAERKILVLDCCHAGAASPVRGSDRATSSEELAVVFQRARGLVTIASCSRDEKSLELAEKGMGLFTFYLTDGLRGAADTDSPGDPGYGMVDHVELFSYAARKVAYVALLEGTKQTPALFHDKQTTGIFALARYDVESSLASRPVRRTMEMPEPVETPKPGAEAAAAYDRLANRRSKNPAEDALVLVREAANLRQPVLRGTQPPTTRNPYYTVERAAEVQRWLRTAVDHVPSSDADVLRSVAVSQALAAFYSPERDEATARQAIDTVASKGLLWKPGSELPSGNEAGFVQAQLLRVYAETRSDRLPEERLARLDGYCRLLLLSRLHDARHGAAMDPYELHDHVLAPALRVADGLRGTAQGGDSLAQQVALVFGSLGDLVIRNRGLFFSKRQEALQRLQEAVALDPQNPGYARDLAAVLLLFPKPQYERVAQLAQSVLASAAAEPVDKLIAQRLHGHALLGQAWEASADSVRQQSTQAAIAAFDGAAQLFQGSFKSDSPWYQLARTHFVESLVGRSSAYILQANFLRDLNQEQRKAVLTQAVQSAQLAAAQGGLRTAFRAYTALGNALEDRAWLCKVDADWPAAAEAFQQAIEQEDVRAEGYVNLARCRYKWGVFGKKEGELEEAVRDLRYVIEHMAEDKASAQAHYYLALIHKHQGRYDEALRSIEQAWKAMERNPEETRGNKTDCLMTWSQLLLERSDALLALPQLSDAQAQEVQGRLANAAFRGDALREFSRAKSAVVHAFTLAREARLLEKQRADAQAILKKLQRAVQIVDAELQGSLLSDERATLLWTRAKITLEHPVLWDAQSAVPQRAVDDCVEAARLAIDKTTQADALAWAGIGEIWIATRKRTATPDSALQRLREAVSTAPEHPQSWLWRKYLAVELVKVMNRHRVAGSEPPVAIVREAVQLLDNAAKSAPADQSAELLRYRQQIEQAFASLLQ